MPEEETLDILMAEEEPVEPLKLPDEPAVEETETEVKEDKPEEEKEPEIELQGEQEYNIVTPVSRKDILAQFPDLYKKIPFIETALSQHKQLTEILPTVEDAKEAVDKASAYDNLYAEVMDGKTESILSAVKEDNKEAFLQIVDDYLPALARVDEGAFHHVVGNLFKDAVQRMYAEAREGQNEALSSAAHILHQWVFGTGKWEPPTKLAAPKETVDANKQKEQEYVHTRLNESVNDLDGRVKNVLKATIDTNIDPNKAMTPFIKKQAVKEAMDHIENLISNDKGYRAINDRLWRNAINANFSQDSLNKIRSNYLARAKSLLRPVLAKARTDALEGLNLNNQVDTKDRKGRLPVGKSASQTNRSVSGKSTSAMKPGESTLDFLLRD